MEQRLTNPIQIRMGGYGPATTGFSRALKFFGDRLAQQFGDRVAIKCVWNIMDLGYRAEDVRWLVEYGLLTLGYMCTAILPWLPRGYGFLPTPRFIAVHGSSLQYNLR
jgi:hypothetical protein